LLSLYFEEEEAFFEAKLDDNGWCILNLLEPALVKDVVYFII